MGSNPVWCTMKNIIVEVKLFPPKPIPGYESIVPMYDDVNALSVTFKWQNSDYRNCVGSPFRSKEELKKLIGEKQFALFLKGQRAFMLRRKFIKAYSHIF